MTNYIESVEVKMRNNLEKIRRIKQVTQKDLSIKTGIDVSTLSRYESDTNKPGIEAAITIAQALGVTVEQIWQSEAAA